MIFWRKKLAFSKQKVGILTKKSAISAKNSAYWDTKVDIFIKIHYFEKKSRYFQKKSRRFEKKSQHFERKNRHFDTKKSAFWHWKVGILKPNVAILRHFIWGCSASFFFFFYCIFFLLFFFFCYSWFWILCRNSHVSFLWFASTQLHFRHNSTDMETPNTRTYRQPYY